MRAVVEYTTHHVSGGFISTVQDSYAILVRKHFGDAVGTYS